MSFEKSVKHVDEIIGRLSEGDIPLEEAVELYKSGIDELAKCKKLLDEAEKSVMKVTSAEEL